MNRFFKKVAGLFADVSLRMSKTHLFAYASQATLFTLISLIPFLMLLLNVLQAFLPVSARTLENMANDFLPVQVRPLAHALIDEFSESVNVPIVSLTTIALIWTASRGVKSIAQGIKLAFSSDAKLNYFSDSLYSLLYTIVFIAIIVVAIAILLFGEDFGQILLQRLPVLKPLHALMKWRYIIFIAILISVFMTAYKFLGKTKIPFSKMLVGAVFSSTGVVGITLTYSIYIENFSKASYIYGSLAAVMFMILWVWLCMIILLLGAHINRFIYENDESIFKKIKDFWQKY